MAANFTADQHARALELLHALDSLSLSIYREANKSGKRITILDATAAAIGEAIRLTSIPADVLRHAADML